MVPLFTISVFWAKEMHGIIAVWTPFQESIFGTRKIKDYSENEEIRFFFNRREYD